MKNPLAQRMITGLLTLILALGSGPGVTSVAWARTLTEASGTVPLVQDALVSEDAGEAEDLAAEKPEPSYQEEAPVAEEASQPAESEAATPAQLTVSEEAPARLSPEPLRRDGAWVAAGDFQVSGGTAGVDYQFTSPTLHILTSTPLTVKNTNAATATSHNIEINAGVKADLTLAGVNISCDATSPINMVTNSMDTATGQKAVQASEILHPTKLHLTLADGSINTLANTHNSNYDGRAGIRVGWGSVLVIDDSVRNLDTSNQIVTPANGVVAKDVTLVGGQTLKAGDPLTKMDSANPGSLAVAGGAHSAGIGGGNKENAGTIIINGGNINSKVQYFTGSGDWGLPNGSGIGGGASGSGTIITINGGRVEATGGSCGTGIGAGFGYVNNGNSHVTGSALPDAIAVPEDGTNALAFTYSYLRNPPFTKDTTVSAQNGNAPFNMQYPNNANFMTVAGDISINGGYVIAHAAYHGNAIGQCCAHGGASNEGHVIRVTGGTVISEVRNKTSTDPYMYGIGARKGYTIVTGGSVLVESRPGTTTPMFQGLGDTAYNTLNVSNWDDVIREAGGDPLTSAARLPDSDKVQMVSIDLSSEFAAGENKTVPITQWKLEIDNLEQNYGSPSYLDDGKLYLWLPLSATGKKVSVTLSYRNDAGEEKAIEPLYVEKVGDASGSLLKRYIDIDIDKLPEEQQAYFGQLTKRYDGRAFETLDVSKTPIDTTPFEASGKLLNDASQVSVSYQQYDKRGGSPLPGSSIITTGSMPADTGIFKFELLSKQFAKEGTDFGKSYWGHRIAGWSEITPANAVLTVNSIQWGHLDTASGTWTEIKDNTHEGAAGNRLRLDFNIRSANTESVDCAAPTGSFQVSIKDKKTGEMVKFGDPIPLTSEAITASFGSTFNNTGTLPVLSPDKVTENRHATQVVYYLDPAQRDGLLDLLKSGSGDESQQIFVEYIADKNYVQGADKNPDNQDDGTTVVIPVTPEGDITSEGVDVKDDTPTDPDKPVDPEVPGLPDAPDDPYTPTTQTKVVRKTINASYGTFHNASDPDCPDYFPLKLESDSAAPIRYSNTNPVVVDYVRDSEGAPQLDENGALKISVNSCGTTVLVMDQGANAFYNGTRYIITVNIDPDPTLRPQVQVRLTWRNLTAMGEAEAPSTQAARFSALKFAPAPVQITSAPSARQALAARAPQDAQTSDDRSDTPPRPGDTIEYTVSGLNITPGSAWKAGELIDTMREHLKFMDNSVELAANYPTHSDKTYLGTLAFYQGFDWDSLDWQDVAPKSDAASDGYVFENDAVKKAIGTVFGGQSTSVRFTAEVLPGAADRPAESEGLTILKPEHDADGKFGKSDDEYQEGEFHEPLKPLTNADIQVIDDIGYAQVPQDPDDPDSPTTWKPIPGRPDSEPEPKGDPSPSGESVIIPADPKDGSLVTTVKVENTEKIEQHEDDRTLVGDKLKVTATASNTEADTKLADAVIKVVVPEGIEPLPGTLRLTDATGKVYEVPDSAYNPKTGIIAVTAGDIYGGEAAQLTFDAEVLSTQETRRDQDPQYPDRPQDLPIDASTYGDTPTEEWRNQHRSDDDDSGSDNPGDEDPGNSDDNPGGGDDNPGGGDDNPGGGDDKKPYEKPAPGHPFDPEDHGTTWEELDEDKKQSGPNSDPVAPPVLPASPQVDKDESKSDIKISKEAQNLSRDDGATYIGDTVSYSVVLSNSKPHTAWYNAVIRDPLPEGLEPVPGTIKLTDAAGATFDVPDSAYDPETRLLAVSAGTLLGGTQATLTFQCTITEDALGADIGNVAEASGESPAGVTIDADTGAPQIIEAGQRFDPPGGWDEYLDKNGSISNAAQPAYAPGTSASQGPLTAQTAENPTAKTQVTPKGSRIVPTGDEGTYLPLTLGVMALLGVAAATVLLAKERR